MSTLIDVTQQLNETQAMIRTLEAALREDPQNEALQVNLESLYVRVVHLEEKFLTAANQTNLDICSYRIYSEHETKLPVGALGAALSHFQKWFSIVYDSVVNGPKTRARIGPEIVSKTTMDFGFTFQGSVGVALTVPRDRVLFDTHLEKAMQLTTELISAEDSEQVHHYSEVVGAAAIKALYALVQDHIESGTGVEIRWLREDSELASACVDGNHMKNLGQAIDETSDQSEEEITIEGILVGADTTNHTFHMAFDDPDVQEIRGKMSENIGSGYTVELPKRYIANVTKSSFTNFATDKETEKFFLNSLAEPN